ncbi:uncharacterized protein LOC124299607 [Neodiprion virginianus]|uniref:uncharacterized protein LOC124299607 n=1 Tax=Neodiprion virginianus TaxID=2961670 RepID=UPI001EE71FC7|nr:uncharacterized protein LOC124299607 [Neodiprion virginianus]
MSSPQMRWKLHRWFDWASRHGVSLSEIYPGSGVRSLKLIDILTRMSKANESDENIENVSESKKVPKATTPLPDIGMWTEFEKIAPYLEEIHILYKPTDFEYHARVSDLLPMVTDGGHVEGGGAKGKTQPGGGRDGKKVTTASSIAVAPAFLSSLKWQEKITNGKNGPLYMLIDSMDTKFVLIDYYWMSSELPGRRDDSSPSYLTVEKYNFFERSNDDEPAVASIQTCSTGATIFEAGPGRHLYRIFFRAECSFVRILSDTIFHLGDRLRIQELMSFESDRVEAIANNISNKVSQAFQAFGKPEYAGHLRALYKSYMPSDADVLESNLDKKVRSSVHETFLRELGILVQDSLLTVTDSAVICRALRVFFMNSEIAIREGNSKEQVQPNEKECDDEDAELTFYDKAVVGIQSFFKMALMRMYKSMHLSSHNKHSEIAQSLRKVVELFDYSKRESVARLLVRKVISSIPAEVRTLLYPCNKDLSHVLNIDECRGVLRNVHPNQWVPILRFVVNVPRPGDRVFAAMDFVASLPRYLLRVVNNETHREVVRIGSTVATAHYPYVESGYTVIGYGWSDGNRFKELNWHFRVATIKGEPMFSPAVSKWIKPPGLCVQELSNIYVPNVGDIIGKWIVKVATDSLISFRLSTSYDLVEIVFKVFDRDDRVLYEATGGSVLILPSVLLSHVENRESFEGSILQLSRSEEGGDTTRTRGRSKSLSLHSTKEVDDSPTEYHVRAYVANDSWPLKPSEWVVANEVKARGTIYDPRYGRTSTSSILKRGTRNRASERGSGDRFETGLTTDGSSSTILQHPSCKLQVVTDAGTKVQVVHKKSIVEQDKRRETEITAMKRSWEESEPGRLQRGRSLRESFLEENCVDLTLSPGSEMVDFGSSEDEEGPLVSLGAGEIRTLKPPPNPSRILPPWNITAYVSKDEEEEDRWVKTEGDEEVLRNQRTIYSLDFDQAKACRVEEDAEMIREQRRRYSELFNSYARKVEEYKRLGDAVTEMRKFYISEMKPASPNRDGKNAEDTSMKKKKKKMK